MALIEKFYRRPEDYDVREHVAHNLESVLNANRGFGTYLADVGCTDLWDQAPSPRHMKALKARVVKDLARWEPRVVVETLQAAIEEGTGRLGVRIALRLRDGRRLTVAVGRRGAFVEAD